MRPDLQSAGHAQYFQYQANVDGLRGMAVLGVLAFHAFPDTVPGGYVGVDVFFVISGFLITSIIARQLRHGIFSFADFYWRRVRRLFPGLVLVLAATVALGWLVLLPEEFKQLGKHVVAAAMFVANIALWRESGYFDTAAEFKPLLHLWSLGIEEQFYLLWPAILVFLWRRKKLLIGVLSVLVIGSFVTSVTMANGAPVANFYSPVSRFWELGLGCLLGLLKGAEGIDEGVQERRRGQVLCAVLPFIGFALITTSALIFDSSTPFPGWPALLPVAGALLILATPEHTWFQRRVLGSSLLVWVGLISYALYLWHWPLFAYANILEAGPLPPPIRWVAVVLSFFLAWLTYRFVELPVRRRKGFKVNIGLAAAAAAAGIAGLSVYAGEGVVQRFDSDVQALRHEPRLDQTCLERLGGDKRINYCRTTSPDSPTIVFLGDSRAQAIYEGAAALLAAEHSVMLLGRGGCPPLLHVRIRGYDLNEDDCDEVWQKLVQYIGEAKPKVVVIVGNGSILLTRRKVQLIRDGAALSEPKEAVFEHGVRSLINELTQSSKVIYLTEIPAFSTPPSCFLRGLRLPTTRCTPEIDRQQVEHALAPYSRILARVRETLPNVQIVNAVEVLCASKVCSQRPVGKPILYSDALHLSPAGGRLLVENSQLPELISRGIRLAEADRESAVKSTRRPQ